jgi:hypothetical protein
MVKNSRDKIPKSGAKRHPRNALSKSPPLKLSDVPGVVTVRLDNSGRYFRCSYCNRLHTHPPANAEHYLIGYGACDFYGCWMPIDGGDRLGVVRVGVDRKLYTEIYGARAPLK